MPETQQVQKREDGAQIIFNAPGIDECLKGSDAVMVLRITPAESTLSEGYFDLIALSDDAKLPDYTVSQLLRKYVTGENEDQAKKIRKSRDAEGLGAYDAALSLLKGVDSKKIWMHVNGGPNKIDPNEKVRRYLSLREQLEDGKVKPNSGVPILDLILEKDNDGGIGYRI